MSNVSWNADYLSNYKRQKIIFHGEKVIFSGQYHIFTFSLLTLF